MRDSPLPRPRLDTFSAAMNAAPVDVMSPPSWDGSLDNSRDESSVGVNSWIVALCSITFDLDVGQQVEECYPPDALSEEEQKDIAFHSFPDSMSMELHSKSSIRDSLFFYRLRRRGRIRTLHTPQGTSNGELQEDQDENSHQTPTASSARPHFATPRGSQAAEGQRGGEGEDEEPAYLYGYVFCRQRQDSSLRRGGEQRSVVVVSEQPFHSVLRPLSQVAGPLYFSYGCEAFTQVYMDICNWPLPRGGMLLHLQVAGINTISAVLPAPALLPTPLCMAEGLDPIAIRALGLNPTQLGEEDEEDALDAIEESAAGDTAAAAPAGLGVFGDVDIYTPLKSVLSKLWILWEMALVGEPLVVVAPSPSETSTTVAAIASLAAPLPYVGDFRPYYTIHDPQFTNLSSGNVPGPDSKLPRLIGITNLYFLKVLYPKWQNILSVGSKPVSTKGANGNGLTMLGAPPPSEPTLIGSALKALRRRQQGPLQLMGEHCEMLWASYQPLSRPDQGLLARLVGVPLGSDSVRSARLSGANTAAIRQHFEELTMALLAPFKPYIVPKMPPPRGPLPKAGPDPLPAFDADEWLEEYLPGAVADAEPILLERLGSSKAIAELYRRVIGGTNFLPWMQRRQEAAAAWQERTWDLAAKAREVDALRFMDEVTMVQTFYSLERSLEESGRTGLSNHALEAIKYQICMLFEAMPMDLQKTLLSSPARSLFIQGLLFSNEEMLCSSAQEA